MAYKLTLTELNKLGEYSEQYGVRYWGRALEEELEISFNSKNPDIKAGDILEAEEKVLKKTSPKPDSGKQPREYTQFKKIKVVGTNDRFSLIDDGEAPKKEWKPSAKASPDDIKRLEGKVDIAIAKLDQLLGVEEALDKEVRDSSE